MTKERVTTFIDAVLAIVMTILVLDLKAPSRSTIADFFDLRDQFIAYFISFFLDWHNVDRSAQWLNEGKDNFHSNSLVCCHLAVF